MNNGNKDIIELRRRLTSMGRDANGETFLATVRKVDTEQRTCTVEAEGVAYEDVLLHAVANPDSRGGWIQPAVGSIVLVSRIGGSNELYVAMTSEAEALHFAVGDDAEAVFSADGLTVQAGDTRFHATSAGFSVNRGQDGLRKTLEQLIDAICQLTVSTGAGPSGPPLNVDSFMTIKTNLTQYLKD